MKATIGVFGLLGFFALAVSINMITILKHELKHDHHDYHVSTGAKFFPDGRISDRQNQPDFVKSVFLSPNFVCPDLFHLVKGRAPLTLSLDRNSPKFSEIAQNVIKKSIFFFTDSNNQRKCCECHRSTRAYIHRHRSRCLRSSQLYAAYRFG